MTTPEIARQPLSDLLQFDPDRWTLEREAARRPYAYHPFAPGQRVCTGNNFSLFALVTGRCAPRLAAGYIPQ